MVAGTVNAGNGEHGQGVTLIFCLAWVWFESVGTARMPSSDWSMVQRLSFGKNSRIQSKITLFQSIEEIGN